MEFSKRLQGGIQGLLIGDSLGVPYEFHQAKDIPERNLIEMEPPKGFIRAHESVPIGTWSDDGAQALCLLSSLVETNKFDMIDFSNRLVAWYNEGYLAIDGKVFDVGVGTSNSLRAIANGISPFDSASKNVRSNGNGALMRILPLALWHLGSDIELVNDAHLQTLVTHGHPRAWVCSALYVLWVRNVLFQRNDPWRKAVSVLREIYKKDDILMEELEFNIRPDEIADGHGYGYVVDCLNSARMLFLKEDSYESAVKSAIELGNDTDTTAAVVGGIMGVQYGIDNIPKRWREELRGHFLFKPLLKALVKRHKDDKIITCK